MESIYFNNILLFFLARGEWSEDEIRWVVHEDIDQNLEDQAKDQALIFFYKYLEYLQDLSNIQSNVTQAVTASEQFQMVQALRKFWFNSDQYEAFFSLEEKKALRMLEYLDSSKPFGLSMTWRHQAQAVLRRAAVPLPEVTSSEESGHTELLERFSQLVQKRALWYQRVSDYLNVFHQWRGDGRDSLALEAYRQQWFSPSEQKRLSAYEQDDTLINDDILNLRIW